MLVVNTCPDTHMRVSCSKHAVLHQEAPKQLGVQLGTCAAKTSFTLRHRRRCRSLGLFLNRRHLFPNTLHLCLVAYAARACAAYGCGRRRALSCTAGELLTAGQSRDCATRLQTMTRLTRHTSCWKLPVGLVFHAAS